MNSNIGCVIVTFNRMGKLKKALDTYHCQEMLPKYIIVVNNASTDGTTEYLKIWQERKAGYKKVVVNLPYNIGGSGGFYEGQKAALNEDADWIMLADDDAYLDRDYIKKIQEFIINLDNTNYISILCGKLIQHGTFVNPHRGFLSNTVSQNLVNTIPLEYYEEKSFECDVVSYVGPIINKNILRKAGLVNKDYFIWYDDTEHCMRFKRYGKIVCITSTSIFHDTPSVGKVPTWKEYYGYRNQIDLLKNHKKSKLVITLILLGAKAILCPLKGRRLIDVKSRFIAIKDGLLGNLGKNEKYKP